MSRFGLIGKSLSHSFSAGYFATKFKTENIAHSYENFELAEISELKNLLASNPDIRGLNVTIPYKEAVLEYLDSTDKTAQEIGAVNTIKISEGKTLGYNTDHIGFRHSIKPFLKHGMEKALILGTGGASKAVVYALKDLGLDCFFVSRTPQQRDEFSYNDLNEAAMKQFRLIINTTPLGTFPHVDQKPDIPYEFIGNNHLLYDLIYNPEETSFLRLGRENGANTLNGLSMLKLQAEESWKIWNSNSQ